MTTPEERIRAAMDEANESFISIAPDAARIHWITAAGLCALYRELAGPAQIVDAGHAWNEWCQRAGRAGTLGAASMHVAFNAGWDAAMKARQP
jgi:hypothetical protein